ncbi:hypothetical protein KP509_22G063400 [Ceratopteris richardii]|nr:hypothetical protein KP509_22G063400 [Ceratopteris richardii]
MVADTDSSDDDAIGYPLNKIQKLAQRIVHISLDGMPGGSGAFEVVAKFCYGEKLDLMANNVAMLRCAAEYLHMSEEYGGSNLIKLTENFLDNVTVRSWKDSIRTLKSCEPLLPLAEELSVVKKCVESITMKISSEPSLYGWPELDRKRMLQSPSGKLLWSGNSAKEMGMELKVDWWYEDISILSLPLFKCVICAIDNRGLMPEAVAGALMYYARKAIPGMQRRQEIGHGQLALSHSTSSRNSEQLFCLETIENLLPSQKCITPTVFLSSLLKVAMILHAEQRCLDSLEKRIGAQLEHAVLDDILIPNYSELSETLYDVDCVERIVKHFVNTSKSLVLGGHSHELDFSSSSSAFPLVSVAKLVDSYAVEIASDANLSPVKFRTIVDSLPHGTRVLDDGLYQAIDIYLKSHPSISETEKDALCSMISCEKLTQEACVHAAQNSRLPLRIVAQVLFAEQTQLRAAFTCALEAVASPRTSAAEYLPTPHQSHMLPAPRVANVENLRQAAEINQIALRADLTTLRHRIAELEDECIKLRQRLERKAVRLNSLSSKLGCRSSIHAHLPSSISINPRLRKSPASITSSPCVVKSHKSH